VLSDHAHNVPGTIFKINIFFNIFGGVFKYKNTIQNIEIRISNAVPCIGKEAGQGEPFPWPDFEAVPVPEVRGRLLGVRQCIVLIFKLY
jgi:hypothetical protein